MLSPTIKADVAESRAHEASVIEGDDFQYLLDALQRRGYVTIGPTIREGAVVYEQVSAVKDFPAGWSDVQTPGKYRLSPFHDDALFGYTMGLQSWKRYLYPPVMCLWRAVRNDKGFSIEEGDTDVPKYAFIGVRACELAAIAIQDKIYLEGEHVDRNYQKRRDVTFIVAMNCTRAGGTCFCASMQTGPKVDQGFDLAMTELLGDDHCFVVEVGSVRGAEVLADVPHRPAKSAEVDAAERAVASATEQMGREMQADGLPALLYSDLESPRWDDVSERCLACGNCTMVCPTCFCVTVEDTTDVTGNQAERWRRSDSCFTGDFSYVYGGSVRASTRSRYRQWMTHKLSGWHEQFGVSGCVGCGRCITWCPVGIDITAEVQAFQQDARAKERKDHHAA